MNHVYDVAEWIVYNIEDLGHQYMESASPLPFSIYVKNRVAVAMQHKYSTQDIENIFNDDRIKAVINFYQEDIDESKDTLH